MFEILKLFAGIIFVAGYFWFMYIL
uniref:Uncharacterized protein n=1 Tax=Cronobacter phage CSP1 TaxID=1983560 RepID=A0AB33CJ70_9CAUD